MNRENNCYGCDGRGWVVWVSRESITPYKNDGEIVPGCTMTRREYMVSDCPICKGAGIAPSLGSLGMELAKAARS